MSESPTPARVCRFVPAWALVVLVATLASLAVNVGPGVGALVDYATHAHPATLAPLTAPGDGQGALCDTDAHCAALTARQEAAAGRVPTPVLRPASDGGTGYGCPEGWEVTGWAGAPRCVPSSDVIDT